VAELAQATTLADRPKKLDNKMDKRATWLATKRAPIGARFHPASISRMQNVRYRFLKFCNGYKKCNWYFACWRLRRDESEHPWVLALWYSTWHACPFSRPVFFVCVSQSRYHGVSVCVHFWL
jgi:hypothetical protein